jgi:hypothetical protein
MTQVSAQPLTEMSTKNVPGVKGRPTHKADNLTAICEPIAEKMWEPPRPVTGDSFNFTFLHHHTLLI